MQRRAAEDEAGALGGAHQGGGRRAPRRLELVITLALNQLTVAAALVYWPKPVGKHGGYDEYGASATAAMMQKYGSV